MFTQKTNRSNRNFARNEETSTLSTGGLLTGTMVETARGWRAVETLKAGDQVQTFDGGLRPLREVLRHEAGTAGHAATVVSVPGGALDTCSDMQILAEQRVLLDLPEAEGWFGTPLVLAPAAALEGWHGITLLPAARDATAFALRFDDEEVVWANTGALLHCPRADQTNPRGESEFFAVSDYTDIRDLLGLGGDRRPAPAQAVPGRLFRVA